MLPAAGNPVIGDGGPIVFQPTDKDVSIAADGTVTVLAGTNRIDAVRGKLRVVNFVDRQRLQKEGSNLFSAVGGAAPRPDPTSKVRQGFIEKSNVSALTEMSRMLEVTRTYQQISTVLQQQSDLHKSAIEKLADVPA